MNNSLSALAIKLAGEDISFETGKSELMKAGKALIPAIGFEAAVDAMADAVDIFERHHLAASARRMRERNQIKGFRFIPKLG